MGIALFLFLFGVLSFLLFIPISTIVHELGHGIVALINTKKKVTLYIGSLGEPEHAFRIPLGRLILVFNLNLIKPRGGLCRLEEPQMSFNQQFIYVLMGPVATLFLGLSCSYVSFFTNVHDNVKMLFFLFSIYSFIDFMRNIMPSDRAMVIDNGSMVFNDGMQLKQLLKFKKFAPDYEKGVNHFNNHDFDEAVVVFEKLWADGYQEIIMYKLLISSYLQVKKRSKAIALNKIFNEEHIKSFDFLDYGNSALLKSYEGDYEEAITQYNVALETDQYMDILLNNRGYTYNLMGEYELALQDFEKAITLNDSFAYALNNRGFAKVKLGLKEEGLQDLEASMKLDDLNSYCYLNFGIYHFENEEYQQANNYFLKAQELDATTVMLDEYLEKNKVYLVYSNKPILHNNHISITFCESEIIKPKNTQSK
ncbi:MAG: tetratricopeptide repeat protein [Nonlabens sp.]|uniref:tetratricopeptide repeat protein n=1 Tax=Nonlabens sp. TaxID=1888209 RepID=UPI003EF651C3